MSTPPWGRYAAGLLVVGLFSLAVFAEVRMERDTAASLRKERAQVRRHMQAYFKDLDALRKDPLFPPVTGLPDVDVGAELNGALPYDDEDGPEIIAAFRKGQGAAYGRLDLPRPVVEKIKAWGGTWVRHAEDTAGMDLDFSWMQRLPRGGHWNMLDHSPALRLSPYAHYRAPLPNVMRVLQWARLRLLDGLRRGDPVAAAADVRNLARLLDSSETLIGQMYGCVLLHDERGAYTAYTRNHAAPAGWRPLSEERIERHRRSIWAGLDIFSIAAPPGFAREALRRGAGLTELCGALNESANGALFTRPVLQGRFPEIYRGVDRVAEGGLPGCRLDWLRRIQRHSLSAPWDDPEVLAISHGLPAGWLYRARLLRGRVAMHWLSQGNTRGFRFYGR